MKRENIINPTVVLLVIFTPYLLYVIGKCLNYQKAAQDMLQAEFDPFTGTLLLSPINLYNN